MYLEWVNKKYFIKDSKIEFESTLPILDICGECGLTVEIEKIHRPGVRTGHGTY